MQRSPKAILGGGSSAPAPTKENLMALYEKNWIDDWYAGAAEKEEYRKKGKKLLEKFFDANCGPEMKIPLHIEQDFNLKVGDVTMRGAIDRIDPTDGGVEIIDYKTGKTKTKKDVDTEQLVIYHMAACEVLGYRPVKLTYYYLESGDTVSFTANRKDEEDLKMDILKTVEKIRNSDFQATPSESVCKFCDFRDICDFRAL